MKLQTQIPLQKRGENHIDYQSKVLLLGSCFVENIGSKLAHFKFQNCRNPFGILFHPKAIEALVLRALQEKPYTEAEIFFNNEQWHCFEVHSQLSNSSKDILLENLNVQRHVLRQELIEASHIIITLGTAWIYRHTASHLIVANCHKIPAASFTKTHSEVDTMVENLQQACNQWLQVNPNIKFIFTVSPVRHIKDGIVENIA